MRQFTTNTPPSLQTLSGFYSSAFAGFTNVLFFPPLMLLVLLLGYIKARLNMIDVGGVPDTAPCLD
ncbi:hypothetical protein U5A82_03085 [Sphingobium sp. CR2-8]|uniref:hypothetical protein n=1 Tax=Sphingobium sp. CR2-8 TaxID=1306534 RepID=UPI002DBFF20A|nr:hypothetical protein [Sphingobium sp. CR2-8]MEC3909488.1 hypothetical protein [Sphingobium sp. CR2-8]